MSCIRLSEDEKEKILRMNWWGHDGRWYMMVSNELGFDKANEMNMAINRAIGKLEIKNLMAVSKTDVNAIKQDLFSYIRLNLELCAKDVFEVSDFYKSNGEMALVIGNCPAYQGTKKAGYASNYQCACYKRVEGWLDAVNVVADVRLEKSLINGDESCKICINVL